MANTNEQVELERAIRNAKAHVMGEEYSTALQIYEGLDPTSDARVAQGTALTRLLLAQADGVLDIPTIEYVVNLYDVALAQEDDPFTQAEAGRAHMIHMGLLSKKYAEDRSAVTLQKAVMVSYSAERHIKGAYAIRAMMKDAFEKDLAEITRLRREALEVLGTDHLGN